MTIGRMEDLEPFQHFPNKSQRAQAYAKYREEQPGLHAAPPTIAELPPLTVL